MLEFTHPAKKYENDILAYRHEVILSGGDFDGTAGLGNFNEINTWLEFIHLMEPARAEKYGYYPTLVYLAFDGDMLLGICNIRLDNGEEIRRRAGHIGYHVRPSMRQRGYGKLILAHAVRVCAEHGIDCPVVCTLPDNLPSQKTAAACGFISDGNGILENGEAVCRFVFKKS